jgi:hypothetical protein
LCLDIVQGELAREYPCHQIEKQEKIEFLSWSMYFFSQFFI